MRVADEKAIKVRYFGAEGALIHAEAINSLHRFAQLTDCPAGRDVIGWFSHMTGVWQDECAAEYRRERARTAAEVGSVGMSEANAPNQPGETSRG